MAIRNHNNKSFSNIAFPLVKRVSMNTIGSNLVSVQPLSIPNPILKYLNPLPDFTGMLIQMRDWLNEFMLIHNFSKKDVSIINYDYMNLEIYERDFKHASIKGINRKNLIKYIIEMINYNFGEDKVKGCELKFIGRTTQKPISVNL